MQTETHRAQRITTLADGTRVSSVNYTIDTDGRYPITLDETCVFYTDDDSEVEGTYDDHDDIVRRVGLERSTFAVDSVYKYDDGRVGIPLDFV